MWAVSLAVGGLALGVSRWLLQGAGNVYSDLDRRFYVPDPDLGWRLADARPLFLGLDALAVLAGLALAVAAGGFVLGRLERRRGATLRPARAALWAIAALALVPAGWAMATGLPPDGAVDRLPRGVAAAPPSGVAAGVGVDLPPGRYVAARHPGTSVVISIAAGGERFDGRFAAPTAVLQGDPGDLAQPISARVEVAAAAIDTGVVLRSEHAAELLAAGAHPTIALELASLDGARAEQGGVSFAARGTLALMGTTIPLAFGGTLRAADADAQRRLGIGPALLIRADAALDLRHTPLAARARDFDDPRIDVHVDLVLVRN